MPIRWKERSILPGFGPAVGFTVLYLSLIVLIPLSMLFIKASALSFAEFVDIVAAPRVVASFKLSFGAAFAAAAVNSAMGTLVAWVLVRYEFPGKELVDALIDLPFALPTAVAGITLTTLYAETGWIGGLLARWGVKAAFTPLGIVIALTFIGLPFVVRTVQPVLQEMDLEAEEAAASLGASRIQTLARVVLPPLAPAILTGFSLAFARSLGEYGSVVFISGNMPMKTEIMPLMIMTKLEQFDVAGATAVALVMLLSSFVILAVVNTLQWRLARQRAGEEA